MVQIQPIRKALAYITRRNNGLVEVLVHEHRDFPDAGLQVPAGTVARDEEPERAVLREVEEESGLTNVRLVGLLARYLYYADYANQYHDRFVYHLEIDGDVGDEWEHVVASNDADSGLVFLYRWYPVAHVPELAGRQGDYLLLLAGA